MRETFAYLVLPDLQGKGRVRQRSLSADLIFWFFCIKTKELSLRGYERNDYLNKTKIFLI